MNDIQRLEKELSRMCHLHKQDPKQVPIDKLDAARLSLNLALTSKAKKHIRWSRAKFYHQRDTIGSILAAKLSPQPRQRTLPKIRVSGNHHTLNPQRIMESFHNFYEKLYSAGNNDNEPHMNSFLDSLPIPKLEPRHHDTLESLITVEEVLNAIKNLRWGSTPGPDGFSTPYYKTFALTLAPHLTHFFISKTNGYPLAKHLNSAYISYS